MRHSIRFVFMVLLALSCSIGVTRSVSAQSANPWGLDPTDPAQISAQGEGTGGSVQKSFELTLTGDVPEGEVALVVYETSEGNDGAIIFCGPTEFGGEAPCEAGTYTSDPITLAAGTEVSFIFAAGDPQADEPRFVEEGMETLTESMVNQAAFDYGGDQQQDDTQTGGDEQKDDTQADEGKDTDDTGSLPVTGGAVPACAPLGSAAAALGLLLTSGYALLRRQ